MKTFFAIVWFPFFLLFSNNSNSQNMPKTNNTRFAENIRYGGGVGLSFGNNFFSGTLSPFALYEINPNIMTGAGLNLTYSSFNDNEIFVYGGSIINLYRPVDELQLSVEFEQLRVNRSFNNGAPDENYWYPALFLGAGYTSGPVTVGLRYDVLYNDNRSIYASAYMPFVRVLF
jgi:hypothetical protein